MATAPQPVTSQFDPDVFMAQRRAQAPTPAKTPFDPDEFMATRNAAATPATIAPQDETDFEKEHKSSTATKIARGVTMGVFEGVGAPESTDHLAAVKSLAHLVTDRAQPKTWIGKALQYTGIPDAAVNFADNAAQARNDAVRTADARYNKPEFWNKVTGIASRAAAEVPLVGPGLAKAAEGTRSGIEHNDPEEIAHGAASGLTQLATLALGGTKAGRAAADAAITKTGGSVTELASRAMAAGAREPEMDLMKALKPASTRTDFAVKAKAAIPEIQKSAQQLGIRVADKATLDQAVDHAQQRIWKDYTAKVGPNGAQLYDGGKIAAKIRDSVPELAKHEGSPLVGEAENLAKSYDKPLTLDQLENFRRGANADLESYYAKYPSARNAAKANPELAARVARADALRDAVDEVLQDQTGSAGKDLRQQWGALNEVKRASERRGNVALRQDPQSLTERMAGAYGTAKMGAGLLTGNIGAVAEGALSKMAAKAGKEANSMDGLIERAFNGPRAVGKPQSWLSKVFNTPLTGGKAPEQIEDEPAPFVRPQPKGLLPEKSSAATELSMPDTSGPAKLDTPVTWTPEMMNKLAREAMKRPPSVAPSFQREITNPAVDDALLGTRGQSGVRQPIRGLLPNSTMPAAPMPSAPPSVPSRFRMESTGGAENPDLLGTRGQSGVRTTPKGLLPAPPKPIKWAEQKLGKSVFARDTNKLTPNAFDFLKDVEAMRTAPKPTKITDYAPEEIEEAKLLIRQTHDMMASGDKPGRYFAENQPGDFTSQRQQNAAKGITSGGHWYGVKSMRTMLPWIQDHPDITPARLRAVLDASPSNESAQKTIMSAADFIRREKAKLPPEGKTE